jgi:hypothetical protein
MHKSSYAAQVTATSAVPDADGVFTGSVMDVTGGSIRLNLDNTPLYIEEEVPSVTTTAVSTTTTSVQPATSGRAGKN